MPFATAAAVVLLTAMSANGQDLPNEYCPVTTSELAEEQFSVDYQGQQIYFCCNKCKKEFLGNPEAYFANLEVPGTDSSENASSHDHPSSLLGFAGKFHPMVTHFPIALIFAALVFSILAVVLRSQRLDYVSVYSVYMAAFMGVGTVLLGLAAGSAASYPSFLSEYLDWHRALGISTGIVTLLTAYAGRRLLIRSSIGTVWSYRIVLLVNAILVGVTGHFGAILVFGPDHFNF